MKLQELVAPIYWSYLVLTSADRTTRLLHLMARRSVPEQQSFFKSVRVVRLSSVLESGGYEEPSALTLLRFLDNVVHVHFESNARAPTSVCTLVSLSMRTADSFGPVRGLTGLVLDGSNWEAAMLACRQLAPSLRQLSIWTLDADGPQASLHDYAQKITFPKLASLVAGSACRDIGSAAWLDSALRARWTTPKLQKLACGSRYLPDDARGPAIWFQLEGVCKRLSLRTLLSVAGLFEVIAQTGPIELAFSPEGFRRLTEFSSQLDLAPGGQAPSVRTVVVMSERLDARPFHIAEDVCLVELVSRKRLPSLEKVIWVSARSIDQAAPWSESVSRCLARLLA